ncbi:uncharacterized protein AKAME5_002348500 [Lates japonicus]|uniref:Uncharacterized protein n=1 Tax=Lates japonicus TaxID=270547 RepID=A0AAD3NFS5_LATJO|nr:uncharacterized protein AKAME5_002348500 [Lates japonicus]
MADQLQLQPSRCSELSAATHNTVTGYRPGDTVMLFRRRARMLRWLLCGRLGPVWMWKALLLFVAIAFAGQLLGVIFNKSPASCSAHLLILMPQPPWALSAHNHILFLKTHKTASSTVPNMLYRFERNEPPLCPATATSCYPPFNAHRVKGYRGPRAVEFHIMGNRYEI